MVRLHLSSAILFVYVNNGIYYQHLIYDIVLAGEVFEQPHAAAEEHFTVEGNWMVLLVLFLFYFLLYFVILLYFIIFLLILLNYFLLFSVMFYENNLSTDVLSFVLYQNILLN